MPETRLAVLSLGHSGVAALADDLRACLPSVHIEELGLLDGVPEEEFAGWTAAHGVRDATVVHLRGGRELTLRTDALLANVDRVIAELTSRQPDALLYACAGPLPDFPAPCRTVSPYRLLRGFVEAVVPAGRVGIVVPSPLQVAATLAGYAGPARSVSCRAASPVDRQAMADAVDALNADGLDLLVLACFDHTLSDVDIARLRVDVPVVSSRALAASTLGHVLAKPGLNPRPTGH